MTGTEVLLFAHRGGRDWAPENTMAAFRRSLELGVDGIELDVQRCASGEIVVFHDSELSRTTNGVGLLKDSSFEELRRLSAGLYYSPEFESENIPLLEEVLDLVDGKCLINVEIKSLPYPFDGIESELVELMDAYKHIDSIIFSSFDHRVVSRMSRLRPDWNYAVLMVGVPHPFEDYCRSLNARYFHPEYESFDQETAEQARECGITILPWTVNDERAWSQMLTLGVGGIITDKPASLKRFLERVKTLSEQEV